MKHESDVFSKLHLFIHLSESKSIIPILIKFCIDTSGTNISILLTINKNRPTESCSWTSQRNILVMFIKFISCKSNNFCSKYFLIRLSRMLKNLFLQWKILRLCFYISMTTYGTWPWQPVMFKLINKYVEILLSEYFYKIIF